MNQPDTSARQSPGLLAWLGYFVGHRDSVLRMIHARHVVWFAAVLVATAALAREYDAVSLWHHPEDLLGPFGASIILATGLFCWMWAGLSLVRIKLRQPLRQYVIFLSGYWLTAPLAWLYAVPIESFCDEVTSLRFNLTALSVVSIWRVLLFSRVASIQFRIPFLVSLFWILVPCMAVAFMGLLQSVLSLVPMMGGIRLTQTQQILLDYQNAILYGIWWSFIPVVMLSVASIVLMRRRSSCSVTPRRLPPIMRSLAMVPVVAFAVLGCGAYRYQPLQYRAAVLDQKLIQGDVPSAIQWMVASGPDAFPHAWDPLPRMPDATESEPKMSELMTSLLNDDAPSWVVDRFLVQADEILLRQAGWSQGTEHLSVERGSMISLPAETLESLMGDFDTLMRLRSGDDELIRHLEHVQAVVRISLEHAQSIAENSETTAD